MARPRLRQSPLNAAALAAAASLLVVTGQSAAVAQPAPAARSAAADREFTTSFEEDERQPDWRNTVEVGPDGKKRSSGVDGGFSTGIPGNITDKVMELRASGENTGAGETKENLVDLQPGTKWLAFEPTAWIEFDPTSRSRSSRTP